MKTLSDGSHLAGCDQFVDYGEDCEAGRGVDLQLGDDIAAVSGDGMHRKV